MDDCKWGDLVWGALRMHKTERILPTLTAPPTCHLCQLELNVDSSKAYRPGDTVKLNLQTESRALVALGAVDTALYAVGGKSHKPLDMVKVGQVLSLILPSLLLPEAHASH